MYLPEAFQKKMKAILGEEYDDFLAGFEKPRHYGLRVNTAKITVEEFKELVPFHRGWKMDFIMKRKMHRPDTRTIMQGFIIFRSRVR